MTEITKQELIESFSVNYSKHQKKYYGTGTFMIDGFEISFRTDYFPSFDEAATSAKQVGMDLINRFYKEKLNNDGGIKFGSENKSPI